MTSGLQSLWLAHYQNAGDPGYTVVGVASDEFADGTVVELPPPVRRPTGWVAELTVPAPGQVPSRVVIAPAVNPQAPVLWHVLLPVEGAPSERDLVAFSTSNRSDGDVLDAADFAAVGIDWTNQVGALRWDTASGLVRQVYVAPAFRRRGVASKLGWTVACIARGCGWATLQADGRRTDLGEAWVTGRRDGWGRVHIAERTSSLPPMTPPSEADGIPRRNLEPDQPVE